VPKGAGIPIGAMTSGAPAWNPARTPVPGSPGEAVQRLPLAGRELAGELGMLLQKSLGVCETLRPSRPASGRIPSSRRIPLGELIAATARP